jgi:hypothetical protein
MIYRLLFALTLAVNPLPASTSSAMEENAVVKVYYLPFDSDPKQAVTTESIWTLGSYVELPVFTFALIHLTSWINRARRSGPFDNRSVRARIELPDGSEVAIDARGTIQREAGTFRNGEETPDDLTHIFERMQAEATIEAKLRRQWPWAVAAANAQIAGNEGWTASDYGLWLASPWCRDEGPDELCIMVSHREDTEPYIADVLPEVATLGGGKSTLLYFDRETQELIRQMWFQ